MFFLFHSSIFWLKTASNFVVGYSFDFWYFYSTNLLMMLYIFYEKYHSRISAVEFGKNKGESFSKQDFRRKAAKHFNRWLKILTKIEQRRH